ncbi:MAG TPA: nitrilase-related carbon-nitrogen hydrolase [Kofleriaceae bacterium]|nr:nitrilase-related carbon-nitrogen hydrolase [Kofleriaceae bacterium]
MHAAPAPDGHVLRIGVAQVAPELGSVAANAATVKRVVDQVRGAVDLLVFPELTLTGYAVGQRYHELALRADAAVLRDLAEHAGDVAVLVGFIEETDRFQFFNSLALLRGGRVEQVHRKLFLPTYGIFEEGKHFSAGRRYELMQVGPLRVAPLLCADAWNPALAHVAASRGADLFVLSANSPDGGLGARFSSREGWQRLARFYASMYGVFVAFCNRVGQEGELSFWGGSEIIDPFGQPLTATAGAGEAVVTAACSRAAVREARTVLHTIRDDDPVLIAEELLRAHREGR